LTSGGIFVFLGMNTPWYQDPAWLQAIGSILAVVISLWALFRDNGSKKRIKILEDDFELRKKAHKILEEDHQAKMQDRQRELIRQQSATAPKFNKYTEQKEHDIGGYYLLRNTGGVATVIEMKATGEPKMVLTLDSTQVIVNNSENIKVHFRENMMPMDKAEWTAEITIKGDDGTKYILSFSSKNNMVDMYLA
jgi:GR25 family glycosyltransferase involved in LPS biosynthesis